MNEKKQKSKGRVSVRVDLSSRFWKTFLVVLAAFLTFVGPYMVYVLLNVVKIDYVVSMVSGFGLIIVGLVLLWYLIKNKVIS